MIRTKHDGALRCDCDSCREQDPSRGRSVRQERREIAKLERAFEKARRVEARAIEALPEKHTKAQAERCWELAAATNAARDALTNALDRAARGAA